MICKKCGNHNHDGAKFCGKCGCALTAPARVRITMPEKQEAKNVPAKKVSSKKVTSVAEKKSASVPEKKAAPQKKKEQPMTMAARATRNHKPTMASMAVLEEQKRREFMAAPLKEKRRMLEEIFHELLEEYRPELCRRKAAVV